MKLLSKFFVKKRLGAIPSPKSKKDKRVSSLLGLGRTVPDNWMSPWLDLLYVYDQGQSSCCVACSLSNLKAIHELTECQKLSKAPRMYKFAPMWIYLNRDDSDWHGEGMVPSEAIKCLTEHGAATDRTFTMEFGKFNPDYFKYTDTGKAAEEATWYRVAAYYRCYSDIQIKKAVMELGAVSIMYPVYKCLYTPDSNGEIKFRKSISDGNHQMLVVGWDEQGFWVLNSWGSSYGKNGLVHIPYEYKWVEAWAISDRETPEEAYDQSVS